MSWACVHGNVSSVKVCILEENQSHCGTRHFNSFAWPRKLNKNASDGLIACWTDTKILMHMLFSLLVICHVIMRATMVFSSSVQEKLLYKYSHCSCTVWPFWLRNGNWWSGWSIKLSWVWMSPSGERQSQTPTWMVFVNRNFVDKWILTEFSAIVSDVHFRTSRRRSCLD